jgi:PEP-CTERM motif
MYRPLKYCLALLVAAGLATGPSAFGGTVFLDDFNKANGPLVGTTPNTSTGNWLNVSSTATPLQISSNQLAIGTSGEDAMVFFSDNVVPFVGNVIHTGLDVTLSAAQATGDYFQHLGDGTTTNFYQRLFAKSTTGGYLLGLVDTSGTGSTITYGTGVLSFGTKYHVDINWTPVAGDKNDTFALTVDSNPYLTHAWTSTSISEPTLLKSAHIRQGSASAAATVLLDNYTVDAPTVVPEPATIVLLSIVGVAGLGCRRVTNRRSR